MTFITSRIMEVESCFIKCYKSSWFKKFALYNLRISSDTTEID